MGFRISGDLLGCFHPPFDQLQQRQAAAPQALAFLEVVEQRDRFARQLKQHLFAAGRAKALAVGGSLFVEVELLSASMNPNQFTRNLQFWTEFRGRVYRFRASDSRFQALSSLHFLDRIPDAGISPWGRMRLCFALRLREWEHLPHCDEGRKREFRKTRILPFESLFSSQASSASNSSSLSLRSALAARWRKRLRKAGDTLKRAPEGWRS